MKDINKVNNHVKTGIRSWYSFVALNEGILIIFTFVPGRFQGSEVPNEGIEEDIQGTFKGHISDD